MTHNAHLSDFCFCKQHIHFSVLISFWEHNIQYTVNSHFEWVFGVELAGRSELQQSLNPLSCNGVGSIVQHKELDGIQRLRKERAGKGSKSHPSLQREKICANSIGDWD